MKPSAAMEPGPMRPISRGIANMGLSRCFIRKLLIKTCSVYLRGCLGDGRGEGRAAARLDGAVAASETPDRVSEEFLCARQSNGFVPGAKVRQREEPGGKAADGEAALTDESVPGVERAVAFVKEREVSGHVSRGFDSAESADETTFGEQLCGPGFDSRGAPLDLA